MGAGLCAGDAVSFCSTFCSFLTISLWAPPFPACRFCVHHPHQDGGGLPPAQCSDRVRRLCPWPEGAHHLRKSPSGQGDGCGNISGLWGGPCTLAPRKPVSWLPFIQLASCGLGHEPGTLVPAVTFGRDPGPAPHFAPRGAGTGVSNNSGHSVAHWGFVGSLEKMRGPHARLLQSTPAWVD